jgi:glycosyltransferase involved in cell wall biosynthesis
MQSEKISIVIACYNDHEYVEKSVQSALDQTYENKEIIIIDDGSNAITKEVLKKLEPRIDLLITQENTGVSKARNYGIKASTGKFILNLDSDDYFEPTFCAKAMEIFQKNQDVRIVSCYANWFSSNNNCIEFKPEGGSIKEALINNVAMGSSMFKKQDWAVVGGYDESMYQGYEDWEFYIRLLKENGIAIVIPEILFNYRNKINSRNKKANLVKYEILEYIYLKHAEVYKENFNYFVTEWLKSNRKSEAFKQQVMDSLDYKVGHKLLKPFRLMGFFKKKSN